MRGIVLSVCMIVWWSIGFAQEVEVWKRFIAEDSLMDKPGEQVIFMVEGSLELIKKTSMDYHVLRSIDEYHHIVKGSGLGRRFKKWPVNDLWKMNLEEGIGHSYFYIVVSESFDTHVLDDFEIIRKYPAHNTFLIEGTDKDVKNHLLHHADILHITNKVYQPSVESRVIDMNLNPNRVNKIHHNYPTLDGSSEIVSIQENRFDDSDIDLLNRTVISGLESELSDNHATEMTTIIAGAGNSFVTGSGVARKARVTSSDFIDAMPDSDQDYLDLSINTQNHSYGIPRENEYGVEARAFDQSAFQNKNLLHVFSSGNEGLEVSEDGIYAGIQGFANLTGNIKMTKNSLVVGSVDTVGNIPAFVSRGPAYDGRIKPEVVAYSVVGSSNSAALVSGVATLLQHQYREDNASDMPSALTKAFIINGAMDVGPEGIDYLTGFGSINAWRSLEALRNNQYLTGSVTDGVIQSTTLNLPADAVNLKVTLCWTDPAANVNDFPALVNNLDLRLIEGVNETLPWVLNSSPNNSALSAPATRGVDNVNNVEQITIDTPSSSYTIEVEGTLVAGAQDYYVVWQYDLADTFEWDFPTGSDNMPYNGETGSYFRWSTTKSGIGELSYSEDDATWIVLDDGVDLEAGHWRWNNPPLLSNQIRARMRVGSDVFETDAFTVSEPHSARVGFNCADSLLLKWNPAPNAINYTVYNLGAEILEPYTVTTDTFLVIPNKSGFPSTHFSIQPNLPGDKDLLPTPTFDYTLQGIGCYVFSFFQTVALDTGIYLNLSLGTTYGIERIVFERSTLVGFEDISTITEIDNENYTFLDVNPNQGYNEHRVTIHFANGEVLTLSAGTVYYLTDDPLRIFPNPVPAGESFTIITREFEDRTPQLELMDDRGAIVHKQTVQGSLDVIPTGGLRSGIYFYRLKADGVMYSGRVLVR